MIYPYSVEKTGVEVTDSYQCLFSMETIRHLRLTLPFRRSAGSMALEWAIHSACYWLGIQRARAKDVFLEYGDEWLKNLFKR